MILATALLIVAAPPLNGATLGASTKPDVSSAERDIMNRFLAAVLLKDEKTMRALANQDVPVVPALDSRPGLRATTLNDVIERTRSCTLGGANHIRSTIPGYVINWWCEFADVNGERIPVAGNNASIRVVDGKVQLQNFTYGRWGPAPRITN